MSTTGHTLESSDAAYVRQKHPLAFAVRNVNADRPGYKVYTIVGKCCVALSKTLATEEDAWRDAADAMRKREAVRA